MYVAVGAISAANVVGAVSEEAAAKGRGGGREEEK